MNIRIIVFALVHLLMFASCADKYQIEGNSSVSRLDGKMLFVKISDGVQMINIDSAEVVHGLFKMEGSIDTTIMASLYMDDQSIMPLVMEKGNIQIRIENSRLMVSGTPLNDKLYEFVFKKNSLDDRAYEVERKESQMIMQGISMEEVESTIQKEREELSKELDILVKTFICDNYENVLGPGVFMMLCNSMPYPVMTPLIEDIVDDAPETFKNHWMVKEYMELARKNMESMNSNN